MRIYLNEKFISLESELFDMFHFVTSRCFCATLEVITVIIWFLCVTPTQTCLSICQIRCVWQVYFCFDSLDAVAYLFCFISRKVGLLLFKYRE